jgi:hypothetical protein
VAANRWFGKGSFTFTVQDEGMKQFLLLGLLPLAGCGVITIPVIHRTVPDAVYSLWTGRDCSVVRLDEGKTYCRPLEPPPEPPAFCTRSLGSVDCWLDPATVPGHPRGVADGPSGLTAEQEANRLRTWP